MWEEDLGLLCRGKLEVGFAGEGELTGSRRMGTQEHSKRELQRIGGVRGKVRVPDLANE